MPSTAATCVSTPTACVTNTTASIASSISANQLITSNQVAQRQQQQRLLQQQLTNISQPAATTTLTTILPKTPVNSKQKPTITPIPAKKIQRLNGAKFIMTNNCDKTEVNDK
uniref:AT-rich interactive domain-containing protein 2 n=1 Tax=Apis cerana TaxID=7461 RepID=V9IHK6_APICE